MDTCEEFHRMLTGRVRHEIELWMIRQIREGNTGFSGIPIPERHALFMNVMAVVMQELLIFGFLKGRNNGQTRHL